MKPIELEKVAFQRDDRVPRRKLSVAHVAVPQCRSAAVLQCRCRVAMRRPGAVDRC
jgi:hypothetical protein